MRRDFRDQFFHGDLLQALAADNVLAVLLQLVSPAALHQPLSQHFFQLILLSRIDEFRHDRLSNLLVSLQSLFLRVRHFFSFSRKIVTVSRSSKYLNI